MSARAIDDTIGPLLDVEAEIPAELAGIEGLDQLLAGAREKGQQSMQKLKSLLEPS